MTGALSSRPVLLAGGDLNAAARVEAACRRAGVEHVAVPSTAYGEAIRRHDPALVLVDLDEGRAEILATTRAALDSGSLRGEAIAFFSHVDEDLGKRALELGIRALPRGRFWRELPELVVGAVGGASRPRGPQSSPGES